MIDSAFLLSQQAGGRLKQQTNQTMHTASQIRNTHRQNDLEALTSAETPPGNLACNKPEITKKIGNIYAQAQALNLIPEQARELARIKSATELRKQWDYRALGMTVDAARCALEKASTRPSRHRQQPHIADAYQYCPRVKRYLKVKAARMQERRKNLDLIAMQDEARSLEEINDLTAGFGYGYGCVVPMGENFLLIKRDEHTTWSDRKSWKWPTSRSTEYSLTYISALGDTVASAKLDSRKGDWLGKIGDLFDLQTAKRSAVTQTAAMVPVREYRKLNIHITELRLFGLGFSAFCASRGDTHFHASTEREAIIGLARKIKAHQQNLLDDSAVITVDKAKRMGFCSMGINLFRDHLGWQGVRSATAGEIREAIRDIDVTPWTRELVTLGILPPQ
jgi:hypothetical protein